MSYTEAELDALCGGSPKSETCQVSGCGRRVGPYYAASDLEHAMSEHLILQHGIAMSLAGDKNPPRDEVSRVFGRTGR